MENQLLPPAVAPQEGGPEVLREHSPRSPNHERVAVADLPNLHDRIEAMGLTQEYVAFRERYQGWRKGEHMGARGEMTAPAIVASMPGNIMPKGFGYWYTSQDVWLWRRTLSYWIAVTFFEGSLFFTVSSFCFCYTEELGDYKNAMTTYGYIAGKIQFFACTYLMCLETINLTAKSETSTALPLRYGSNDGSNVDEDDPTFYLWPFHVRTALKNLADLGAGPYPYYASAVYFVGVNIYLVGMIFEFMHFLPEVVIKWVKLFAFLLGGIAFTLGGFAECLENQVFRGFKCQTGWIGALFNFIGGMLFLLGSIFDFADSLAYWGSFSFGVGSIIYALGSGVMIIMWKDEQFGLTFMAALNILGGPTGRPLVLRGQTGRAVVEEEATFSVRGAAFIMLYCFAATVSTYNFLTSMHDVGNKNYTRTYVLERSFNALLPCIIAHALLALNSAVVKVPSTAPFRQLYLGGRWLAVLMILSGTSNLIETLIEKHER